MPLPKFEYDPEFTRVEEELARKREIFDRGRPKEGDSWRIQVETYNQLVDIQEQIARLHHMLLVFLGGAKVREKPPGEEWGDWKESRRGIVDLLVDLVEGSKERR